MGCPLCSRVAPACQAVAALRAEHPVARAAAADGRGEVDQLSMVNVAHQIEVLTEHPTLAATVAAGRVHLVGLFFDIPSARLLMLDADEQRFAALDDGDLDGELPLRQAR